MLGLMPACSQQSELDKEFANHLIGLVEYSDPPSFFGEKLNKFGLELSDYQDFLRDYLGENELEIYSVVAAKYAHWEYHSEAIAILKLGFPDFRLNNWGRELLLMQAAIVQDRSLVEECLSVIGEEYSFPIRKETIKGLVNQPNEKIFSLAIEEINASLELRDRSRFRSFVAKVILSNGTPVQGIEEKLFNQQLVEILQGMDWSTYLEKLSNDQQGYIGTILFYDTISVFGSAAEYYISIGEKKRGKFG